ncbi:MAG: hypothetical protein FRX48_05334 [Lasallia pustulata]|nr:MAG: hypothetical protein FRX48_05334 [Lasallia pustulata]
MAKTVLARVKRHRDLFEYKEIDVLKPRQKQWKDLYEFDTPVLHVQRIHHTYSKPDIATEARKLMHRFTEEEVEALIEEAEGHA